jgi:class 3 adenylate cyclase
VFRIKRNPEDLSKGLIETINLLRETIEARDEAYAMLKQAQERLENYAKNLEKMVDERTCELKKAKEKLELFNRDLKEKVEDQIAQLKRYNELRRYLSPKLAEVIIAKGEPLGRIPKRKMMTVLFSDIRNFSNITDSLEPEEIFNLLDKYLSEMIELIHKYDGTLNKIMGDGMLVFFGDPIPMEDHAQKAVMMAIEMQRKVFELRDEWQHFGHDLQIGIGINTGFMTVGNIGSDSHRDYTVIGNQVNLASRLVSMAEPGQILITRRTMSRVKNMVNVEKTGLIRLKGLHQPVQIYNVKF